MANLGMADTLILMVLALVVFGPRRLPQIGRQIGKLMYEFRKASNDFKFQMEEELRQAEEADRRKKQEEERQRALVAPPPAPPIEATTPPATTTPAESPTKAAQAEMPAMPAGGYLYGDVTYPKGNAESGTGSATEQTVPPAPSGELTEPRILPPSTGERVATNRPNTPTQQQVLFAAPPQDAGKSPDTAVPETETEPATHHAAHHG